MTKNLANQQVWVIHRSAIQFSRTVLDLMMGLAGDNKIIQQLHLCKSLLYIRNKGHKYRAVCRLTGRARASTRRFGLTRIGVRKHGHAGFLPGFTKASW